MLPQEGSSRPGIQVPEEVLQRPGVWTTYQGITGQMTRMGHPCARKKTVLRLSPLLALGYRNALS